MFEKIVDNV